MSVSSDVYTCIMYPGCLLRVAAAAAGINESVTERATDESPERLPLLNSSCRVARGAFSRSLRLSFSVSTALFLLFPSVN